MEREKKILDITATREKIARGEKITFAERNILNIFDKRNSSTPQELKYGKEINSRENK